MASLDLGHHLVTAVSCAPNTPGEFSIELGGEVASGVLSPTHVITFEPCARAKCSIPPEASYFAFAYPLSESKLPAQLPAQLAHEVRSFIHGGGFVYFKGTRAAAVPDSTCA